MPVGEREPLGLALNERDPLGERRISRCASLGAGEHVRALVERHDLTRPVANELGGDQARPGRHVEHPLVRGRVDPGDERAPPAGVLAEAHDRAHAVVATRQTGEQLQRVGLAGGALSGRRHLVPKPTRSPVRFLLTERRRGATQLRRREARQADRRAAASPRPST